MISTLDISSVTDRLIQYLEQAVTAWPGWSVNGGAIPQFNIEVSGLMPEVVRNRGGCQMTFYLFHVAPEPYTRNMALTGTRAQPNTRQALGLTLYYLVTTYSQDSPQQEQQAISIALKALHERGTYVDPGDGFTFTVTLEGEKPDDANRRWQSFSTPFRLSAVYRVSVTFLTPAAQPGVTAPPPQRIGLGLGATALPFARAGALTGTASRVDFAPLNPAPGDVVTYEYAPAIAAPGGSFAVFGNGLDQPTAQRLYLVDAAGTETEVTAWKGPPAGNTAARVVVTMPATVGPMPGNAADAGFYQLRAGSSTVAGDALDYRTNTVALLVAARTNAVPDPWTPAAGVFSFSGTGFIEGEMGVLLDTVTLAALAQGSAPTAGTFALTNTGDTIRFRPPAGLPAGTYYVRLRVRGVEGPAVGRIALP